MLIAYSARITWTQLSLNPSGREREHHYLMLMPRSALSTGPKVASAQLLQSKAAPEIQYQSLRRSILYFWLVVYRNMY